VGDDELLRVGVVDAHQPPPSPAGTSRSSMANGPTAAEQFHSSRSSRRSAPGRGPGRRCSRPRRRVVGGPMMQAFDARRCRRRGRRAGGRRGQGYRARPGSGGPGRPPAGGRSASWKNSARLVRRA
jgi:hypothetical protein